MANDIIKKHNFELYKAEIRKASAEIPKPVTLKKFQTEGDFIPWNDHNVTGDEVNALLVKPLQEALIKQNENTKAIYGILHDVYRALDSLDSQYIAGILTAVESAKVASNQAMRASDKATIASNQALDASDKAITAQEDIKRTIEALQKAVGILRNFKENVDRRIQAIEKGRDSIFAIAEEVHEASAIMNRISHLRDLDTIWSDVEGHKVDLAGLHKQVDSFAAKMTAATQHINRDITVLQEYRTKLEAYVHLADIDTIWSDVEGHKANLAKLHEQVDRFVAKMAEATQHINRDITVLQEYRTKLEAYIHLGDIDTIWSDVEGHKDNLAGLHQKVEGFVAEMTEATQRINRDIVDLQGHRSRLENYVHLGDIDTIWSDVQGHKDNLAGLHQKVEGFVAEMTEATQHINRDIVDLQGHRSRLENYVHLGDIDTIWSDVEGHKVNLARLHQRVDSFIQETQDEKHSLRRSINELRSAQQEKNEQVDKKLKVAYGIAGGAVTLSLTQLILFLMGIL